MTESGRLGEKALDTLGELASIGAGQASTALSKMLGRSVLIELPDVGEAPIRDVPDLMGGPEKPTAALHLTIDGGLRGNILLLLAYESARDLSNFLLRPLGGGGAAPAAGFSEEQISALKEVGNILSSSYLSALARLVGRTILPSTPSFAFDMVGAVLDEILGQLSASGGQALIMKTHFEAPGMELDGIYLLLPDPASARSLADLLAGL